MENKKRIAWLSGEEIESSEEERSGRDSRALARKKRLSKGEKIDYK